MKVETQVRDIQRSSSFEEKTMGLAVGSEAFVFNVLRKDLYSDPIGSLIREYTVNAQDEHRKHGKSDVPILIQVPNQFSPELHIRDYANGLTEEQVFEFFGNYGASDKRDSNVAVGFFGLGCKSAFAYTDSYIVKSFKDGIEYTFNIYIDETEIGKTAKISEEATTEPNGIQIIVPVKSHDINTFQNKVISTIQYFKVKPTITGMSDIPEFDNRQAIIEGEDWKYFGNGTPKVLMGEIAYPVDYYKMGDGLASWEERLLQSDIHIHVSIGDVQVTASREALQMSEKTIATIRKKLADIKDTMVSETTKRFAEAKTLFEAKTLWYDLIDKGGNYAHILRSHGKIMWKGEEINSRYIDLDISFNKITTYHVSRSKIIRQHSSIIECDGSKYYFDDTDKKQVSYKRRARTLLMGGVKEVRIIHTSDKKAFEDYLGFPVTEFESLNLVPETKSESTTTSGGTGHDSAKSPKHTSKVFVLNLDRLKRAYSASSEVWDVKEVENLKGVYIPIDRFQPRMQRIASLSGLRTLIEGPMENAGMPIDVPIYGIKKETHTLGLARFDTWIAEKVKSNKNLQKEYSFAKSLKESTYINGTFLDEKSLPDNSLAKDYALVYKAIAGVDIDRKKFTIFNHVPFQVEADTTLSKLSKKFELRYPMLTLINYYDYKRTEVTEYIAEKENTGEVAKAASA